MGCSAWRYLSQPYDYEHVAVFEQEEMQLAIVNCAPEPVRVVRWVLRPGVTVTVTVRVTGARSFVRAVPK